MKKSLGEKPFVLPTPVWTVGAYDLDGKPNAMIAAWGGICSSDPASLCVACGKADTPTPASSSARPSR
ncbi:hypothetical protein [Salidesulfovibrio brasiliensis]|uniref:hypothetical protein n=1 Tax=Salidesulfovibrio brasiliensis TaxID=221711 RepID=UPI000AA25BFB